MIEDQICHNLIQTVKRDAIIHCNYKRQKIKTKQSKYGKFIEAFVIWCPGKV